MLHNQGSIYVQRLRLRLLQIRGVKPLGEPGVYLRQQLVGFLGLDPPVRLGEKCWNIGMATLCQLRGATMPSTPPHGIFLQRISGAP